ncbi:MAG: acetyl/propionyl/methylcrotonyl-CoA carboxylase subunit alpha [Pseudomonadota bacterium]
MFKKILIANRGEIAVRIAQTAKRLGIETVAVFSDADTSAPHVRACDEAIHIGQSAAAESYLKIDKIISAMRSTGAEAVHPGYGFLSENATFADALDEAGLTFIGPTAETINAMGSKSAAKDLMEAAGVPTTPGYQGADQGLETFRREAEQIGYPVLLKATAGGGGKGMRLVQDPSELEEALGSAQREAISAFGDDRFLIEKYIARARHVEVQIFGDGKGDVVHMFERDCSLQRRHQKVIEEAPAPHLPGDVRARLLQAGVDAGRAVNYRGAGTVEFLYDGQDAVYFMEMNTRLQVEHPVSEFITGLDFVEWQLRIAAGEGLPLRQDEITENGHAFEARLYAETPGANFAPSIGTLTTLQLPRGMARIDSGVEEGQEVTPFYDPMIAKVVTHGPSRETALRRLSSALSNTHVAGLETNASFLHALGVHPAFVSGDVSTKFIDDHADDLFASLDPTPLVWAAAALWRKSHFSLAGNASIASGFRLNQSAETVIWVDVDGHPAVLRLKERNGLYDARLEGDASAAGRREKRPSPDPIEFSFKGEVSGENEVTVTIDGHTSKVFVTSHLDGIRIWVNAQHTDVNFPDPLEGESSQRSSEGSLTAPMPGVITVLKVTEGDSVEAGAPLLVMEAMKMEHTIKAPQQGVIRSFHFQPGDQVRDGDLLVEFEEA